MQTNAQPLKGEGQIHAERLSQAQIGWLPVAIRLSRRLEQRARRRRLILARRVAAGGAAGAS